MKLSALTLFLILLVVLVISVLFCRRNNIEEEGFISYNKNGETLSSYEMSMYSVKNELLLLYDNVYFDSKNGNLVELDGIDDGTTEGVNNTSAVNKLHVTPRVGGSTTTYNVDDDGVGMTKEPSQDMANSYKSFIYYTKCENTSKYAVCMIPWHKSTYVHMMDTSTTLPTNLSTSVFSYSNVALEWNNFPTGHDTTGEITEYRNDTNSKNDKFVLEPTYNTGRKVYQISEYVKYDVSNSNLLVSAGDDVIVYNRNSTITTLQAVDPTDTTAAITTGDGDSVANKNFSSRIIYDLCGQNMIVYVPNAKKTLVALICYDDDSNIDLRNVCRFNEKGIDTGEPDFDSDADTDTDTDTDTDNDKDDSTHSHGYGGYDSKNFYGSGMDMNDYLLKSQIVPPVCPSCPSCHNVDGACNQCGGTGGCGAKDSSGNSLVAGNGIRDVISETSKIVGHTFDAAGNILTGVVNTTGNVGGNTVDAAGNIINSTVTATGNVGGNTFDAAGNIISGAGNAAGKTLGAAGDVVGGALGAAGKTIGGVFGGAGNVIGGAVDAVGNAGGSRGGSSNGAPQMAQNGAPQMAQNGITQSTQNDPYSYSGQLTNRPPTSFVPRTADFSTFGK
jgi:hypothetical protein